MFPFLPRACPPSLHRATTVVSANFDTLPAAEGVEPFRVGCFLFPPTIYTLSMPGVCQVCSPSPKANSGTSHHWLPLSDTRRLPFQSSEVTYSIDELNVLNLSQGRPETGTGEEHELLSRIVLLTVLWGSLSERQWKQGAKTPTFFVFRRAACSQLLVFFELQSHCPLS